MSWLTKFAECVAMFSIIAVGTDSAVKTGSESQNQKLRPAGVAGEFYPADAKALTDTMDAMLSHVSSAPVDGQIIAVVAPHAGYPYSGPVAAYSYATLKGLKFSRVVVIAPSHYERLDFTSVYEGDGYVTPLGPVQVDKSFARKLALMNSSIQLSDRGHQVTLKGAEHAIEVQLPWLQHQLGKFKLVPIVMGDQSYDSSRALGVALAKVMREEMRHGSGNTPDVAGNTLIVASSDLSHYHTYAEAETLDRKTLSALEAQDYFSMSRNFQSRVWEACGGAPVIAAMIAAERMGANHVQMLKYANSGDVTGDRSRVVGYGAAVFVRSPGTKSVEVPFSLSEKEKQSLLAVARRSVESAIRDRKLYEPDATGNEALDQERGAFVTLKEAGQLRGCIGFTSAAEPLYRTIRDTATLAATRDPRFHPVSADELAKLEYEISVLSPLLHVRDVQEIEIGRDGLLMRNRDHEGLLLPQVPVEQHWDRTTFLEQTCLKAGMPKDCWKGDDTDIFRFTALVFGEARTSAVK